MSTDAAAPREATDHETPDHDTADHIALDTAAFDPQVRAQDDLFRHVNGPWLASATIAPDRATAGAFVTLVDESEAAVRDIITDCTDGSIVDQSGDARRIGDLFASFMDEAAVNTAGAEPLREDLQTVQSIETIDEFVRTLGALERSGVGSIIGLYIAPDRGRPDRYVTHVMQGGIGLPDESYYTGDDFAPIRAAYVQHMRTMFELAGLDAAAERAERVMDLETRMAAHHWDRVACRDAQKTYNLLDRDGLQALLPAFDLTVWADAAQIPEAAIAETVVAQPSFLEGLRELLVDDELPAWSDWLRWQIVHAASPYLSDPFVEANFDFYGRTLSGTDELRPRWKRGVGFVESCVGEAVGRLYVERHFPPASRERMADLIDALIEAYRQSIRELDWMSDDTKVEALAKLESFTPKIGHPKTFKDYSSLHVDPSDLLGNARRSLALSMDRELDKIGQPIDRDEWFMTPQTVNAYYNPTMNEIVFPAAILQPPFFHADADDAVNYGAIGAVIGHEIGHGFDDQGSHYDGTGSLRNWWTDDDRAAFDELAQQLIAQYDELSPAGADGQTVNGSLTIGENIGDLGGLGIAHRAFRIATAGQDLPEIDGLSPDQRFFLSWAQAWQGKVRPAETVRRLTTDPHSPPEFRCNQVVRNLDAFYEAFQVSSDDALWLDPQQRVGIWV